MLNRKLKQLREVQARRASGEKGFTLIELLVVIIIIGILASIAIPIFMNQQKTARDAATTSDVKNVATNIQTGLVKFPNASYFALTDADTARTPVSGHNVDQDNDGKIMIRVGNSSTAGDWEEYMVTLSKGTRLGIARGSAVDDGSFIIEGFNPNGKSYTAAGSGLMYLSNNGGLQG